MKPFLAGLCIALLLTGATGIALDLASATDTRTSGQPQLHVAETAGNAGTERRRR